MKKLVLLMGIALSTSVSAQIEDVELANQLASLPLKCMQQEYPNKLNQVLSDGSQLRSPQELHPAFYGCFDWHSSVHGHWMLVKLLKDFPKLAEAKTIREKLSANLSAANIQGEMAYFDRKENRMYERTYGWAWLLKLQEELITWDDRDAKKWAANLQPLIDLIVSRYQEFLPKLEYAIRTGEHPNTAFGLSFAYDYAVAADHRELQVLIEERAKYWYATDKNGPLAWEPNGFDFLSPCLEEARLMSRVMPAEDFKVWLDAFLPGLTDADEALPFSPVSVSDRTDGKLVHLDGLNLSRAWCLKEIAASLPEGTNVSHLLKSAEEHAKKGGAEILDGHYEGEHWLASFAVYALTTP